MTSGIKSKYLGIYLLLLLCYASFFTVQCFFNFDTQSAQSQSYSQAAHGIKSHKQTAFQKSPNQRSQAAKLRLNKRFQPAYIPSIPYKVADLAENYLVISEPRIINQAIPNNLRLASLLRGPPVVS